MARHDHATTTIGKEQTIDNSDTITLWRPTGQAELDLVAASGWRVRPVAPDVLEYWIPAEELADLNARIVGAIIEEADYRGPVNDQEFTDADRALRRALPAAWRTYLQGKSWFRRGWMTSGAYVWLNTPRQMLELHYAWDESTDVHPGIAIIGGDGSREQLVLDLRSEPAPVLLVESSSRSSTFVTPAS